MPIADGTTGAIERNMGLLPEPLLRTQNLQASGVEAFIAGIC